MLPSVQEIQALSTSPSTLTALKKKPLVPKLNDTEGSVHCAFYIVYWDMVH